MGIISKEVAVSLNGKLAKYYEGIGYKIPKYRDSSNKERVKLGTIINVKLCDLPKNSHFRVMCECDYCGKEYDSDFQNLNHYKTWKLYKQTVCKDCYSPEFNSGKNHKNYIHGVRSYTQYKSNAKKRGLIFDLAVDEFKHLTSKECHYCGGYTNENIKTNGIDRKDNGKGYIDGNCLPCCFKCNEMKMTKEYDDFLDHIEKIHKKLISA